MPPRDFPELDDGQFAVLQIDPFTGHPLAADGISSQPDQTHFRVYPSRPDAEAFAASSLEARPDSEWVLLDHEGTSVKVFRNAAYWIAHSEKHVPHRPPGLWSRILSLFHRRAG